MIPIVMAGGFGTRIRPLSANIPKPMLPVVNRPILEHVLHLLQRHGLNEAVLLLYHQPDTIKEYFGDGSRYGMKLHYYTADADYGTAGAVKRGATLVDSDSYLVLSGDVLCDFDLGAIIASHTEHEAEVTITLTRVGNPLQFGIVITGNDGRVTRFLEKPTWGEVFSDTINTGIYLLQKEAVDEIGGEGAVDFSKDLFPHLLAAGRSLYGSVQQGYWRDIGDPESYIEVHHDICEGRVRSIEVPGEPLNLLGRDVRVEGGTEIEGVELRGTVVIGRGASVAPGARLENTVIGPGARIEANADLRGAVVWADAVIGARARAEAAVVCEGAEIGAGSVLEKGSVIGDFSRLGEEVRVREGVKIWPRKIVEDFAVVHTNMVWAARWRTSAFEESAVTGLTNYELTPEVAAKLGAAYGALLPEHAVILTSRDAHPASRMLRRAFVGGLGSAGVDIADLRMTPIPIMRYRLQDPQGPEVGGVFFQQVHLAIGMTAIRFYDAHGSELSTDAAKSVERVFSREDFRRVDHDQVGVIHDSPVVTTSYQEDSLRHIDRDAVRERRFRIVVNYTHGTAAIVLPTLLGRLGVEEVTLNAQVEGVYRALQPSDVSASQDQLASIVRTLNADMGVWVQPGAERLVLADRQGRLWEGMDLLMLIGALLVRSYSGDGSTPGVVLPLFAPSVLVSLFTGAGWSVHRVSSDPRETMRAASGPGIVFASGGSSDVAFTDLHAAPDAMFGVAKLLELLARAEVNLEAVADELPAIPYISCSISCPIERKGTLMRRFAEMAQEYDASFQEGVKIQLDHGWVLLRADRAAPRLHLVVEADSSQRASAWLRKYQEMVELWVREEG
jgi:mannose-1-phosphate guanylyltransferase / phosphomannomutase